MLFAESHLNTSVVKVKRFGSVTLNTVVVIVVRTLLILIVVVVEISVVVSSVSIGVVSSSRNAKSVTDGISVVISAMDSPSSVWVLKVVVSSKVDRLLNSRVVD